MLVFGVFGEFDSDNIGDILIGEGAFILLNEQLSDIRKIPLGRASSSKGDSDNIEKRQGMIKKLHRYSYSKYILYRHLIELCKLPSELKTLNGYAKDNISGLDVIIIGGGQLLHDNTLRMLIRILALVSEAKREKKPVVFFGTGASVPRTVISKMLFKMIFEKLKYSNIYLRDNRSIQIITRYLPTGNNNIFWVPDTAIARAGQHIMKKRSDKVLWGLAPISHASLPFALRKEKINQDEWWLSLAGLLIERNITPVLFSSGVEADYERCLTIRSKFKIKNNIELDILPRSKEADTFLEQLSNLDRVVAQRLHISISYFSMGGRPYSLPWDDKVAEFYQIIGMPERHSDSQDINDVFESVLRDSEPSVTVEDLRKKISSCVSDIAKISIKKRCF